MTSSHRQAIFALNLEEMISQNRDALNKSPISRSTVIGFLMRNS